MSEKERKVEWLIDNTYQVVELTWNEREDYPEREMLHQGSLSDCDAWLRLNENGYM